MHSWQRVLAVALVGALSMVCRAEDGSKPEADEVKWEKLPKAVQEGMKRVLMEHILKGETVKVGAFEDKGKGVFEVEAVIDGKDFDFYVDSEGNFAGNEGPEDEAAEAKAEAVYLGITAGEGDARGVVVGAVMAESPAAKAGLTDKDVIESLGGVRIKGSGQEALQQLIAELARHKPGDKIKVGVLRNGKQKELSVTLAARPAGEEEGEEDEEGEDEEEEEGEEDED